MNPALWLVRAAKLYPKAPALLEGEHVKADYAEFHRRVSALATMLQQTYNLQPGDRAAIFMPNRIEYLEVLYAIWYVGAAVVPINAKLHAREVVWMVNNAGAKLVFSAGKNLSALAEQMEEQNPPLLDVEGAVYQTALHAPLFAAPIARGANDLAWLFYTSGTTGKPKGVMITAGNLQAMALTYFADVDDVAHEDAIFYAAPFSHGAGLYNFMFVLRGARHVAPPSAGFNESEIMELAPRLKNVSMFAAPTMVRRLIEKARAADYRGEGIKTIIYGGGPMYVADILEAVECFGPRFAQIYGQGECPMTITALNKTLVADRSHPRWRERLASVGIAQSSVDVKIVQEDGSEVPRGEIGEIIVAGIPVMAGYWQNKDATEQTLKAGWLWTGDMGAMDEDGFITLHDRSKDVIISGGTNIYPREVEEVLLTHPGVAEVSVIAAPDPEWGEIVVAYIVVAARAGAHAPELNAAELDAHCLQNIARFKRPKHYYFLPELPKNSYGKILKTELRDMLEKNKQA